jgi:hypothetical protein
MAGPEVSNESASRRTLRFAFGVTLTFVITQLFSWPLANLAPVFAALLLQQATPRSVRQAMSILGGALGALLSGFLIGLFLLPYPAVMLLVFCLLLFRFYTYLLVSGAHLLVIIAMLVAYVVMPVLVQALPELAFIAGAGFFTGFPVAIFSTWVAFLLIPAPRTSPARAHQTPSYAEATSAAITLTLVIAPLMVAFLVFGWGAILILIYATIFATGMNDVTGGEMGWKSMVAILIYGGLGMLLTYELLVMVPNLLFMIVLLFAVCAFFGNKIFSAGPSVALWASGFIGFLILIGGALSSDDVVSGAKLVDRVMQIFLATAYVMFAFRVIDLFKGLGREWRNSMPIQSTKEAAP